MITASEYVPSLAAEDRQEGMSARGHAEPDPARRLVTRSQSGDVEAFAELIGMFEKRVFHFVLRMTRQEQDAEDITQTTFVKVWKNLHRFRTEHAFSTWLFTIARRTALNHLRALKPSQELADYDEPTQDNPSSDAEDRERARSIWTMAKRLKPAQYEALWLTYGEGFAINETARIMKTNSVRVRVLLHRGRKRMAELLGKQEFQSGEAL